MTSVALATESSGYVWSRAPNGLVHILLVIRLEHKFGCFSFIQGLIKYKCAPEYVIIISLYTHITLNSLETSFLTFFLTDRQTDRQTDRPTRGYLEAPSPELKNSQNLIFHNFQYFFPKTDRLTDRQTDGQTDRQRQRDRQRETETDKDKETETDR